MITEENNILKINHNAGFFSCCTVRLQSIVNYFNNYKKLPEIVDSTEQFLYYKELKDQNLINFFFRETDGQIFYKNNIPINTCTKQIQFSDYKNIDYKALSPFIKKYFAISDHVQNLVNFYEEKYNINYNNLCAVFYRGNDKIRETKIAPYNDFIRKAKKIKDLNPGIKFLVQPDETEFLEEFLSVFPDSIYFEETPHMTKRDSVMFAELPLKERAEYGAKFLAAVIVISKSRYLITHSGNCGLWAILYRGYSENIHQYLGNSFIENQPIKKFIKKSLKNIFHF